MKFKFWIFAIIILVSLSVLRSSHAASSYVLPYPSEMPGSRLYELSQVIENLSQFWNFGSFGKFGYHLKLSDKYIVEGKTLFEYKQYLLAYESIQKSNQYFVKTYPNLQNAKTESKDISEKSQVLNEASIKHIEELEKIKLYTPDIFVWTPEKKPPTKLQIHKLLIESIEIRKKNQ
ncbi:MAG: DUF5667 domain-containing protein [Patescibacteria group bacterium]